MGWEVGFLYFDIAYVPKLLLKYDYFYVNSFYILFEIIIFSSDAVKLGESNNFE